MYWRRNDRIFRPVDANQVAKQDKMLLEAFEDADKSLLLALRFKRYKEARRAIERNVSLYHAHNSLE